MEAVLDLVARTAKYQADLEKAGNFTRTQTQKMAVDFHKAELATGKSAAAVGKFRGTEQAITRSKEAVANLAQAMSVLSPEAGAAVMQISALGGALKAATVVAPVVVAVAALALAYKEMGREMERESALAETNRRALASLEPVTRQLEDARLALANATGQLTDEELRYQKAALSAQRGVQDLAKQQATEREELRKIVEGGQVAGLAGSNNLLNSLVQAYRADDVENARARLASLDAALARAAEAQRELRYTTIDTADATAEHAKRTGASSRALREYAEVVDYTRRASDEYADTLATLASIDEQYTARQYDAAERIQAEYETQAAVIEAREQAALQLVQGNASAEEEAHRAAIDARASLDEWYYSEREKMRQADLTAEEAAALHAVEVAQAEADAKINATASVFGSIASLAQTAANANEDNAVEAFRVQQIASAAEVAVLGVQEIARGYAEGGVWGAAAAAIMVAAQEAAIWAQSPPSFYSGGLIDGPSTGFMVEAHPQEAVLNRTGRKTLGDEAINAANRGESAGPTVVVENRMDRGTFSASMARSVRGGGRLARELSRNTGRLGHRS